MSLANLILDLKALLSNAKTIIRRIELTIRLLTLENKKTFLYIYLVLTKEEES
jgi:hypothetical protein